MTDLELAQFERFTRPLLGLPISHVWNGHGPAIFLEFGTLTPRTRRNGTTGNPQGEMAFSVEWSWRIEGKRRVWCGSWSDKERWERVLPLLKGATVARVSLFGRLGEVALDLSNGLHLLSFMTYEGDPEWTLMNEEHVYISVLAGRLHFDYRNQLKEDLRHA